VRGTFRTAGRLRFTICAIHSYSGTCIVRRIASRQYHQLRSALAQVSGRKELIGHTDWAVAISNECGGMVANIVIAYNSILLSGILTRDQAAGHQ